MAEGESIPELMQDVMVKERGPHPSMTSPLPTEALEAIIAGTEKCTPGPWICYPDRPSVAPNWHIVTNASRMRVLANVHIEPGNAMDEANAAHIARLSPEVVRAIATELLVYRRAEK